jgi:hypothetical protein
MQTVSKHLRPFQRVHEDKLYPPEAPLPDEQGCDRRHQAIAEVLCRLPEDAYQRLKRLKRSKRRSFSWFIPHLGTQGLVYPFPPNVRPRKQAIPQERFGSSILSPHARVIYLSPFLELRDRDHLVYVVAHELAHVWLNHALHSVGDEGEMAEREAYRRVCLWGFEYEAHKTEGRNEELAAELTDPESDCLPEEAIQLLRLARAAGIEMGSCYPESEQMGTQFHSAGDIKMFFKVARCGYRIDVEQRNGGDESSPSFQVMLLAFVPTPDLPRLVKTFREYVAALAKPPEAAT